jgi:PhnB protein
MGEMTQRPPVLPEGYHTVTPWIIANGAGDLVAFIERVFGGREKEGSRILNGRGRIDHVEVQLGDSVVMLFDSREGWPETPSFLRVYVEDADAVVERARESGATFVTNVTPLFFGEKVGRVRDPRGNLWWIHERTEEIDPQEMERRMGDPMETERMRYVQESLDRTLRELAPKM